MPASKLLNAGPVCGRIGLLAASSLAISYLWLQTDFYAISTICSLFWLGLWGEMAYRQLKLQRDLHQLFLSLRTRDFTVRYPEPAHAGMSHKLYQEFNDIGRLFQQLKTEREVQHQYLQTIVSHVDIGLICLDESGQVVLSNQALQQLLGIPYLRDLNKIEKDLPRLAQSLSQLHHGEQELVRQAMGPQTLELVVHATEFSLEGAPYRLFSLKNIRPELEKREQMAWQALIRTLAHEIMNSVTPIASLSTTLLEEVRSWPNGARAEDQADLEEGLDAIERRSKGLLRFTQTYRNLAKVPEPDYQEIKMQAWLSRIQTLMQQELMAHGVHLSLRLPPRPVSFHGDPALLDQVLLNLIQNARQALKGQANARIQLKGRLIQDRIRVSVYDNGPGIKPELWEKVFVPFFTTKVQGSGIGLSLSRQILLRHNGILALHAVPGEGSHFWLEFPRYQSGFRSNTLK